MSTRIDAGRPHAQHDEQAEALKGQTRQRAADHHGNQQKEKPEQREGRDHVATGEAEARLVLLDPYQVRSRAGPPDGLLQQPLSQPGQDGGEEEEPFWIAPGQEQDGRCRQPDQGRGQGAQVAQEDSNAAPEENAPVALDPVGDPQVGGKVAVEGGEGSQ